MVTFSTSCGHAASLLFSVKVVSSLELSMRLWCSTEVQPCVRSKNRNGHRQQPWGWFLCSVWAQLTSCYSAAPPPVVCPLESLVSSFTISRVGSIMLDTELYSLRTWVHTVFLLLSKCFRAEWAVRATVSLPVPLPLQQTTRICGFQDGDVDGDGDLDLNTNISRYLIPTNVRGSRS